MKACIHTEITCANCGGEHTADNAKCPARIRAQMRAKRTKEQEQERIVAGEVAKEAAREAAREAAKEEARARLVGVVLPERKEEPPRPEEEEGEAMEVASG
ncbi:MAG: hypothetical protein MMC33_010313 [Icmadophila ericetorum]|nr:hypothetical protein [Icmadophila ericetorum]